MNHLFLLGFSVIIPVISIDAVQIKPIKMTQNKRLSETEVTQQLQDLSGWQRQDQSLSYTHTFNNFIESVNFVNCLVEPAETLGHHPDLNISYNKVTINLTTHDAGGLTALDFKLAQKINQILENWTPETTCLN